MAALHIEKDWQTTKKKLKHNFRHLTEKDLCFKQGREEELIGRLERKLGNNKSEVIEIIHRIQSY